MTVTPANPPAGADAPGAGAHMYASAGDHSTINQVTGDQYHIYLRPAPRPVLIPQQLPAAPGLFTGRADELAALTAAMGSTGERGTTVVISAIGGAGGIGKTWLALHWAHQHLDRFPDGQLFVDLRGFDPAGEPMAPEVAVRGFLDALGVEPAAIPVELDAQVGLYRSLVANRRMLIVLDNAREASQVSALLPGAPTCTVLVTSRDQLAGLVTAHGARPVAVEMLCEADARDLLIRRLGPSRLAAEPPAVTELLHWCAGLPLALGIVAARAALQPGIPLALIAAELRDAATRLGALDEGAPAVSLRAVLSCSYQVLAPDRAEMFRLLGLAPGPDISVAAAAALAAIPPAQVGAVLRALERVSLVQQHTPGRYRMHDLVRLYVGEQADRDQPPDRRDAAVRRLVDFYLHTALAGDRLLAQHRPPSEIGAPVPGGQPHPLPDRAAAWAWFDTEHACLLAAQQRAGELGWHRVVWQLAWTLDTFHLRRGHLHDNLAVWQAGLAAAEHLDDQAVQAMVQRFLGDACSQVGSDTKALDHLQRALTLAEQTGDLLGQAHTHHVLAQAWEQCGDDERGLEHATHALHLFQALNNPVREARARNAVGWYSGRLGHYQQAYAHCEAALASLRHHHDRQGESHTLDSLGYLAHRTGQHAQALDYYQQALVLYRDLANTYEEANTLDRLGQTHVALGQRDQARHTWRQALMLFQAQHRAAHADRIQQQLEQLDRL